MIDGYNGLLIDPTEEALYGACKQMILDRKETERMAVISRQNLHDSLDALRNMDREMLRIMAASINYPGAVDA